MLASTHMTAYLQQHPTFCTPCSPALVLNSFNIGSCMLIKVEAHMLVCRDKSDASNRKDSWQQPSNEQPKEVAPTISMLAKELQAQWHQERNMHLGNSVIRPHSHHKVWWSCDQCPDSLPHIWAATVDNRSSGTCCPFCSGASTCQHNTLARQAPQVARFWDAKKNHPLSPDHVTVSSCMRVHWKCSVRMAGFSDD